MKPVIFDNCYGWLHTGGSRHGVVLCSPFGHEAYLTHRGWRMLAEGIAAHGMSALRFDYPGTGDSAGGEEAPHRIDAWIESIASAVQLLRAQANVRTVSLVGMRFGAMLAGLAAERIGDIDGLVLLAPVVGGRGYVRELRLRQRKWVASWPSLAGDSLQEGTHLEVLGAGFHQDDVARLGELDLRRDTTAPARRVLILDSHVRGESNALAEHYAARGVAVLRDTFDEYDRFFAEPLQSRPPQVAFERTIRWLDAVRSSGRDELTAAVPNDSPVVHLDVSRATEQPVVFGPCFGIYCEPTRRQDDAPAVLIVNTSAGHHIGDGRLSVLLARRLAALGIASLRMDFGGLGDSTPAAKEVTVDSVFSEQACRNAALGAEWLGTRGHPGVVAFGVCSGAYVSLHLCARHPAVVGAYAVNLPKFFHGPTAGPDLALWKVYRRSLLDPKKWLKVFRGGATNPIVIARGFCYQAARRVKFALMRLLAGKEEFGIDDPHIRTLVRLLYEKRARVRMIFGELDTGLPVAKAHLGANFEALRHCPSVEASVSPQIDHAVLAPQSRHAVLTDVERWVRNELLMQSAPLVVGEAQVEVRAEARAEAEPV